MPDEKELDVARLRALCEAVARLSFDARPPDGKKLAEHFRAAELPIEFAELLGGKRKIKSLEQARQGAALAVLGAAAAARLLPLERRGYVPKYTAFRALAKELGVPAHAARLLHRALTRQRDAVVRQPRRRNRLGRYLNLARNGYRDSREVAGASYEELCVGGLFSGDARIVRGAVLWGLFDEGLLNAVQSAAKSDNHDCCPPFDDVRWRDRFDYFGPDSRLAELVQLLRDDVIARILAAYRSRVTASVIAAANSFVIGSDAFPFATQALEALESKTTRAEVEAWIANLRQQLAHVRSQMRVVEIYSRIETGDDDAGCGGGDGEEVQFNINAASGPLMNVAAEEWDPGSIYDDGDIAHWKFKDEIPGGSLRAFDIAEAWPSFTLRYDSDNDWLFEYCRIEFLYEINPFSESLTNGRNDDWDKVQEDGSDGWIYDGDEFPYGVRAGSRLAAAWESFSSIVRAVDGVETALNTPDPNNLFLVHGQEMLDALAKGADLFQKQEYGAARNSYAQVSVRLGALESPNALQRELLFALNCLVAGTYEAENQFAPAYANLVNAHAYLGLGGEENREYLWLRLAAVFLSWGDALYASAGRHYDERLAALPFYNKVLAPEMLITYPDGAEDESQALWLDLARADGSVPAEADIDSWKLRLSVRQVFLPGADELGTESTDSDSVMIFGEELPIAEVEVVNTVPGGPSFLRLTIDISEAALTRRDLNIHFGYVPSPVQWDPELARLQVQYATYNPLADRSGSGLHGANRDIAGFTENLAAPVITGDRRSWTLLLGGTASANARVVVAPDNCQATLLRRQAAMAAEQIRAHLNVLGIHDEYVPSGRFQSLLQLAMGLAQQAGQWFDRHLQFLSSAESAYLEEMDAAFMAELAGAVVSSARVRVEQAAIGLEAARSRETAASAALNQANRVADQFEHTEVDGMLRVLNNVNIGIPSGVGISYGGFVGAISGDDGYDASMALRRMEYQAAIDQSETALENAGFERRIAEVEQLLAAENLGIEQIKQRYAQDRLDFTRSRSLSATHWYQLAGLYRDLAVSHLKEATRWAWMAERALEFETNVSYDIVRMDYHLQEGGAALAARDLDRLRVALASFRDRYRDVPNIIEREFRFSVDFPDQFRALTASEARPPVQAVGPNARAVEFETTLFDFDIMLPGRYAFGRMLGVEVELQTDVAPGIFTGHIENARLIETTDGEGDTRQHLYSSSLVRVPRPTIEVDADPCPPVFELDNAFPVVPPAQVDIVWAILVDIPDLLEYILGLLGTAGASAAATKAIDAESGKERSRAMRQAFAANALAVLTWRTMRSRQRPGVKDRQASAEARALLERALREKIPPGRLYQAARSLIPTASKRTPVERRARLKRVLAALAPLKLSLAELTTLETLRAAREPSRARRVLERWEASRSLGRPTWQRCLVRRSSSPAQRVDRDLSAGIGASRRSLLATTDDYVDYADSGLDYVVKIKQHDAESLTLSAFSRRDDGMVYNQYNNQDQLGVFENTGIASWWRLTLRGAPLHARDRTPQWSRIREVIFRAWYHAAYERSEGFALAQVVEAQALRRTASLVLDLSFYRDFYDEFRGLVGDYARDDPASLDAVRSFTDVSHAATNGWIEFVIDERLVPTQGQTIRSALVVFTELENGALPDLQWELARDPAGPAFQGGTRYASAGDLVRQMSQPAPGGFGGLDPRGSWFFRLAAGSNVGRSLAQIADIELVLEFSPS